MEKYIWLFPIIFIVHDMEEIIGFGIWLQRNQKMLAECFKLLWLGGFIACTLHFIVHIRQSVFIRKYIPALITSMICLPISIWIISECISILECKTEKIVLFGFIGIIIVSVNVKFAQSLIGFFTKKGGCKYRFLNKPDISSG